MHRYLRVATATALVAFGTIFVAGVLALFSPAGDLVRTAGLSDEAATPCTQQAWLNRDPNCLSGRDMPWFAASRNSQAIAPAVGFAERIAPEPVMAESRHNTVPQPAMPRSEVAALGREPALPAAVAEDRQTPKPVAAPQTPPVRKAAVEPPAPATKKTTIEAPAPAVKRTAIETPRPTEKKTARRDPAAKRNTREAANPLRRFDDNLNGIPVSSFAADGTRRTIMIRPTSIQDVYYYSSRR